MSVANYFNNIENTKASVGGVYVIPGQYTFKIKACKCIRSRKNEDMVITELEILASNNPERPVGSTCSWVLPMNKDTFLPNFKAFLCVVYQQPESYITQQVALYSIDAEKQPLVGVVVAADAVNITTKAGKPFTRINWFPAKTA